MAFGALVVLVWLTFAGHSKPARVDEPGLLGAFAGAIKQQQHALNHPVVYRVRLTSQADAVADSFVYDEYVTHDCAALEPLTHSLPGLYGIYGPTAPAECPSTLATDRQNDAHLVRGSRVVDHNCGGGPALLGIPLKVNECLKYATEGRYVTQADGSRLYECQGSTFDVFLKQFGGRWFVVAEADGDDWAGTCVARDVTYWKHRFPWRQS